MFYRDLYMDMMDEGVYSPDIPLHKYCSRFLASTLIAEDCEARAAIGIAPT